MDLTTSVTVITTSVSAVSCSGVLLSLVLSRRNGKNGRNSNNGHHPDDEDLQKTGRRFTDIELVQLSQSLAEMNKKLDDPHTGLSAINDKLGKSAVQIASLQTAVEDIKENYQKIKGN